MKTVSILVSALFSLVGSWNVSAGALWSLSVASDPEDPIGFGASYALSHSNGNLSTTDVLDLTGDGKVDFLTFSFVGHDPSVTWDLTFGTSSFLNSNRGFLSPGTYTDAQKAAFADAGHPGLDFSLNGIAASTLTGQFTITDAIFETTSSGFEVSSFAATFEQHAEGLDAALRGDFQYVVDESPPTPIPVPTTLCLLGVGLLAFWPKSMRATAARFK